MSVPSTPRVVVCLDGLDPAYLATADTPAWDKIAASGTAGECPGAVPSLTNVNNVGIVSGSLPTDHGITGNSYFDRDTGQLVYMEDPSYLRCETRFERYAAAGEKSGAVVAKEKLKRFVEPGCAVAASAEDPPKWLVEAVGAPPGIYSGHASEWVFEAATYVLDSHALDVLYVSTTDVVPHKHGPGTEEATEWIDTIDRGLGALADRDIALCATADHGMNAKTNCIDLDRVLAAEGTRGTVIPLIRDRHTYHHQNLGGAAYVYLASDSRENSPTAGDDENGASDDDGDSETVPDVADLVTAIETIGGVDTVLTAEAAADRFSLPTDRIGDLLVLGDRGTVFGPVENGDEGTGEEETGEGSTDGEDDANGTVDLRSHGSHHERTVPYVSNCEISLAHNAEAFAALDAAVDGVSGIE